MGNFLTLCPHCSVMGLIELCGCVLERVALDSWCSGLFQALSINLKWTAHPTLVFDTCPQECAQSKQRRCMQLSGCSVIKAVAQKGIAVLEKLQDSKQLRKCNTIMTRVDSARVKKYAKVAYTRFDMCVSTLFSPFAGVLYTVSALEDPARSRSRSSRTNSRASRQSDSSSRTESRSSSRTSQPNSRPSSRASCCSSEQEMRPACRARSGTGSEPVYCSYV